MMLQGCATGPSSYFRSSSTTVDNHVRVVIIPFRNLSTEKDADNKVVYSLITHLLKSNWFDVIEMGETQRALKESKVRKDDDLSLDEIKKVGEMTGADVLLMGAVEEYKIDSSTLMGEKVFVPEVSINARIVSTKDGQILWSVNHHQRGDDHVTVFGMGRVNSISELTDIVTRDTVRSLILELRRHRWFALSIFKNGNSSAKKLSSPKGTVPDDSALKKENESLKQEMTKLNNEIDQIKEKLKAEPEPAQEIVTSIAPAQEPITVTANPEETQGPPQVVLGSAETPVDAKDAVKKKFKEEYEKIKKQY
jgi:TolB-like protein